MICDSCGKDRMDVLPFEVSKNGEVVYKRSYCTDCRHFYFGYTKEEIEPKVFELMHQLSSIQLDCCKRFECDDCPLKGANCAIITDMTEEKKNGNV